MKRFYKKVSVEAEDGGWRVKLDARPIKTAGGNPQILPSKPLAHAMAREWDIQGEEIDPSAFQLRDLADFAIDVVQSDNEPVIAELLPYAETETLCYRGDDGEALCARQDATWEPLLAAAERRWDVHFERVSGIMHKPQPTETLEQLKTVLLTKTDFELAALKMLSSLAASLVIALTALEPGADGIALWDAANLEEDWQAELWGEDAEAAERRQLRQEAFLLAIRFASLAGVSA